LNITIFPNDVLIVDITGQKAVTLSNWKPAFIEIMVKGYYIPESHLSAYWGSGV
jgi:hypothetical protein